MLYVASPKVSTAALAIGVQSSGLTCIGQHMPIEHMEATVGTVKMG